MKSTYIKVHGVLAVTHSGEYRLLLDVPGKHPYDLVLNEGCQETAKELNGQTVVIEGHLTPGRVIRVDSIQR